MTSIFIYVTFGLIIIVDIILLATKKKTISQIFKKWYKEFPLVPYLVGVIFLGHFQTIIKGDCIALVIIASLIFITWSFIMYFTKLNFTRKTYNLMAKYFFIPMSIGAIIGSFWRV